MADLANLALKHGYYFESTTGTQGVASGDDDWSDQFCQGYDNLRAQETKLGANDEYSHNYAPFVKFLRIIKSKKMQDYFQQQAMQIQIAQS